MLHRYISVFFAAGKDELLFAELAEDFDGGHQGETDEGKTYRPADDGQVRSAASCHLIFAEVEMETSTERAIIKMCFI